MKNKKQIAWFLSCLVLTLIARATPASANPCDADVALHCGQVDTGNGTIAACLADADDKLTYECREYLKKIDQFGRRITSACGFDAREYCRAVRPGYGQIKTCLMSNLDRISNDCRSILQEKMP